MGKLKSTIIGRNTWMPFALGSARGKGNNTENERF